jgi:hypothetical protein
MTVNPANNKPNHSEPEAPLLAPEFIDALAEHASEALMNWLHENAPESLCILADRLAWLRYYQLHCAQLGGKAKWFMNEELPEVVTQTINAVAEAGGTFYTPIGRTTPRPAQSRRQKRSRKHRQKGSLVHLNGNESIGGEKIL